MCAMKKAALLGAAERDFAKLYRLIANLPEELALERDQSGTCIRDVIVLRVQKLDAFLQGQDLDHGAEALSSTRLRIRDWDATLAELEAAHQQYVQKIELMAEAELLAKGPAPSDQFSLAERAEAAGPSQYRSALNFVRARLRQMQDRK